MIAKRLKRKSTDTTSSPVGIDAAIEQVACNISCCCSVQAAIRRAVNGVITMSDLIRILHPFPLKKRLNRPSLIRRCHPYARKPATQVVLSRMQLTFHETHPTPHGTSRSLQAMPVWSVETRRASSRHSRDAKVYGHTTTAMHGAEYTPIPPPLLCYTHPTCIRYLTHGTPGRSPRRKTIVYSPLHICVYLFSSLQSYLLNPTRTRQ